jgi:uncharacterized repeat protein (TIGR01451 family)
MKRQKFKKLRKSLAISTQPKLKSVISTLGFASVLGQISTGIVLSIITPVTAQSVSGQVCQSLYGEVYGTVIPNKIYSVHGPTGANVELTSTGNTSAINGMATDHVNKMVYYGDGNSLYAWDVISNQHVLITNNFSSLLPSTYTSKYRFSTLSSGGAAFYNGSLYIGVDGNPNTNLDFEILKVDFVTGSGGKTIQKVTPLDIIGNSGSGLIRTDEDWGDFVISDTGVILAITTRNASTRVSHLWNYDLNTNKFTNIGTPSGNHQLAKSGDGKLWALFSTGNVQELTVDGTYTGSIQPTISVSDAGECVVGKASVGDRVWEDKNGDGIQDSGEVGIPGVTVAIYRDINKNGVIDATDPKLATQVTDANGNYNFTELLPHDRLTGAGHNDFIVKVEGGVPTGATNTTPIQKAVDLSSATENFNTADFGYKFPTYSVSGTLYKDNSPQDSNFNNGETTLPGNITLQLINSTNNAIVATTTTTATGTYTFSNVSNGNYTIKVDATDSDIPSGYTLNTPNDLSISVSGSSVTNQNFGFIESTVPVAPDSPTYCKSPYGEVYGTVIPNKIYSVHGLTGANVELTSTGNTSAINGMATDHVNKMVYYGDGNSLYAWDVISNQHVIINNNFSSLLPSSYTSKYRFSTLSSGGAAFYNGSLYIGVDGNPNTNLDFEILKVDFVPGSGGKTIQKVTPLDIIGNSGGALIRTDEDWGDFVISDTGVILAITTRNASTRVSHLWNYDLNTNTFTNIGTPSGNHQLAKSGDGKLWALFSTGNVQELTVNGTYTGSIKPTISVSDAGECVVGEASVGERVWEDKNGDGIQDSGEIGIQGVTVAIYRDINKNGVIDATDPKLATQVTGANGDYNFTQLLPHDRLTGAGHNDFIVKVEGGVPGGATNTTPTEKAVDLSSATEDFNQANFGYRLTKAGSPNLILVKRITSVNGLLTTNRGDDLSQYKDEDSNPYDDNDITITNPNPPTTFADTDKWPDLNTFLIGGINGGNVKSGDEIEYTIYFLSAGQSPAGKVLICDRIPNHVSFIPKAFNASGSPSQVSGGIPGADRGIVWKYKGNTQSLTNIEDGDAAQYFAPGVDPKSIYPNVSCGGENTNGAIVINLGDLPNATVQDTPVASYGFLRFRGRVK